MGFGFWLFVFVTSYCQSSSWETYSCLMVWGASARPLTLSRSAVFKNAGSWSWATLTSPAYMNSKMAVKCWNGTSFKIMIGCFAGFSSNKAWKINCTEFKWLKNSREKEFLYLKVWWTSWQDHLVGFAGLTVTSQCHIGKRLFVPQVLEGGDHVGLEVVPS